jgi:hypothetical protein
VLGVALGGCSADLSSISVADLNPLKGADPLRTADYNYFYKRDGRTSGPVTAADLIGPDGRCAYEAVPSAPAAPYPATPAAPAAAPPPSNEPINPRSNQALYFTAGPQANPQQAAIPPGQQMPPEVRNGPRGVALYMTECEVVRVAGYTDRVQINADERGRRSVTLTYMSGDRPGIYHFIDGRLATMERVEVPVAPKKPAPRKVKTAKSKKQ